jgi:hypothetical protein
VHRSVRETINRQPEKKGGAQEEGLRCRQSPVAGCQCLSGDARACNAQRDDLTCEQREDETPCPYARETLPSAATKGADRRIVGLGVRVSRCTCFDAATLFTYHNRGDTLNTLATNEQLFASRFF